MGHAEPSYRSAKREGSRASFLSRRSLFGGRSESFSSTPVSDPQQQESQASPAAQVQSHILYHNLGPSSLPPASLQPQHQHQNQHQHQQRPEGTSTIQHKRRSILSAFRLGNWKQEQEQPVFEYQQPRRDLSPQYSEQLARTQHTRGPLSPAAVTNVAGYYNNSEDDRVSSQPHSVVMSGARTNVHSDNRILKKSNISPPFDFQHVTHSHKNLLPSLGTVDEKDRMTALLAASTHPFSSAQTSLPHQQSTYQSSSSAQARLTSPPPPSQRSQQRQQSQPPPQRQTQSHIQQLLQHHRQQEQQHSQAAQNESLTRSLSLQRRPQDIRADEQSRVYGQMGLLKGTGNSQSSQPARSASRPRPSLDTLSRVQSRSREDITALPGLEGSQKEGSGRRQDDSDTMFGQSGIARRPAEGGLKRTESVKPKNDSASSLLGFDFGLRPTRSHSTSNSSKRNKGASANDVEDSSAAMLGFGYSAAKRSADVSRSNEQRAKASIEINRPTTNSHRSALSSFLGGKERSQSESSSAHKRTDVGVLLGLSSKDSKHQAKPKDTATKNDQVNELLGLFPKRDRERSKSRSRQPPAPLRPRRSDEALKAVPYEATPSALSPSLTAFSSLPSPRFAPPTSPHAPMPERPKRVDQDEQFLQDIGLAQLLYRPQSNESRNSHSTSVSGPTYPLRRSEDVRRSEDTKRVSIDAESIYPPDLQEADYFAEDPYLSHQARFRSKQPLPALPPLPEQYISHRDNRVPLQTVDEHAEIVSPLQSPADSGMSPVSPASIHSPRLQNPRSPELTGPGMPDDETWMDEIDFLYKQNAEATNDFDWDNVSMTPHRLSVKDSEKRHSLNMPSLHVPRDPTLVKKLSEGSLRQSYHIPSSRTSKDLQYIYRDIHNPRKFTPNEGRRGDAVAGARASPEVRVVDVDDQRASSGQTQHEVAALSMHGYESLAAGYLSDPESSSSQHRKSNSYGSWESRRSGIVPKEQPGRSSNTSASSIPELVPPRRISKQPLATISPPVQQPMSPYQEPPVGQHPINEYAAFSVGPYAAGSDSRPQSSHRSSLDQHPQPPLHPQSHQTQSYQLHQQHHHHYYHAPQDHSAAADYLSMRRPETIDENAILRAAGEAVKHGRVESRTHNRPLYHQYHYQQQQQPQQPQQQQSLPLQLQSRPQQPEGYPGWI